MLINNSEALSDKPSEETSYTYSEDSLKNQDFYDKTPERVKRYRGKVILYHGPYEAFNFIRHREGKLRSLRGLLEQDGYYVQYIEWEHFNRMGVEVNEKLIFTCRMTDLDYDGFGNNATSKHAHSVTMEVLKRIDAWYMIKHFSKPAPFEYFSLSFGH